MRHLPRVLLAVAALCFVQAARTAAALRETTGAIGRAHTWRDYRPDPIPVPIVDVLPPALEDAPLDSRISELLGPAPAAPLTPRRKRLSPPPLIPSITEVEPEDAVRLALRGKRASFERCYELELKKQAAFSGFIVVAVSVSAAGQVLEAKVQEGNRRDAVVGACIASALRTMRLPALTSDADLLIPIRLQAKEPT